MQVKYGLLHKSAIHILQCPQWIGLIDTFTQHTYIHFTYVPVLYVDHKNHAHSLFRIEFLKLVILWLMLQLWVSFNVMHKVVANLIFLHCSCITIHLKKNSYSMIHIRMYILMKTLIFYTLDSEARIWEIM